MPWQTVELLTFRLRATTPRTPFALRTIERGDGDRRRAVKRHRRAWFDGAEVETPVYDGARLRAGDAFHGPAIIEETTTSVIIPSSYACRVDELRNYVLKRDGSAPTKASATAAPAAQLVGGAA